MFGNFVVQKMLEYGSPQQNLRFLLRVVKPQVRQLAYDRYGCRVMQRLLQVMPINSHHDILKAVEGIIVETMYHEFGNHVV